MCVLNVCVSLLHDSRLFRNDVWGVLWVFRCITVLSNQRPLVTRSVEVQQAHVTLVQTTTTTTKSRIRLGSMQLHASCVVFFLFSTNPLNAPVRISSSSSWADQRQRSDYIDPFQCKNHLCLVMGKNKIKVVLIGWWWWKHWARTPYTSGGPHEETLHRSPPTSQLYFGGFHTPNIIFPSEKGFKTTQTPVQTFFIFPCIYIFKSFVFC